MAIVKDERPSTESVKNREVVVPRKVKVVSTDLLERVRRRRKKDKRFSWKAWSDLIAGLTVFPGVPKIDIHTGPVNRC